MECKGVYNTWVYYHDADHKTYNYLIKGGAGSNLVFPCFNIFSFPGLRKRDGSEYEPGTLRSIQNSIDRHLRDLKIQHYIKNNVIFSHSRRVLASKYNSLKQMGKGNKSLKAEALASEDISILHEKKLLGPGMILFILTFPQKRYWHNNCEKVISLFFCTNLFSTMCRDLKERSRLY